VIAVTAIRWADANVAACQPSEVVWDGVRLIDR
jgi:hypothetical protein